LFEGFIEKGIATKLIINADNSVDYLLRDIDHEVLDWLKEKTKLFELIDNSDVVVIDSYLAGKQIYDRIARINPDKLLIIVDDYKRINYPKGIIINPLAYADKLDYQRDNSSLYLLGSRYVMLRRYFWNVPDKKIRKDTRDILIIFGGQNHTALIGKMLSFLAPRFPGINYHIIVPSLHGLPRSFTNNRIKLYSQSSTLTIRSLMLGCDIAISGGGQTTYELARCGLPAIGICFADNQRLNLEGLSGKGFLEYVGNYSDSDLLDKIAKAVELLKMPQIRKSRSRIGRKLVDGKGTKRILTELVRIKELKDKNENISLRLAGGQDCYDLWRWRNHPKVRRWCFAAGYIDYKTHEAWFKQKIKNGKTRIYISTNAKKEKIGQVRFDIVNSATASVNVNLNPDFFGRGLGNRIIKEATDIFLRENPKVKKIIAEVIKDNIASRNAFEKAGYGYWRKVIRDNRQIAVFKFLCGRQ
jgi:spore coat polysaccharide biosynthesis predicted glycosyltransferase SpsG/RimJ/RimL family protein N-acetyltransferase